MADKWNLDNLPDSRYVWLPFSMKPDGTFTISWRNHWDFSIFDP
jgi:beta-galactosidase